MGRLESLTAWALVSHYSSLNTQLVPDYSDPLKRFEQRSLRST